MMNGYQSWSEIGRQVSEKGSTTSSSRITKPMLSEMPVVDETLFEAADFDCRRALARGTGCPQSSPLAPYRE
jgi:hypothetical protein